MKKAKEDKEIKDVCLRLDCIHHGAFRTIVFNFFIFLNFFHFLNYLSLSFYLNGKNQFSFTERSTTGFL